MKETVSSIRTLIVDDEPLAREGLRILLGDFDTIEIIGECSNGEEALQRISSAEIDLVFLDIEMPSMTGLEVVAKLENLKKCPHIVFVTAYNEYAVKAFEVHAVDYLLKPIDREMITRAVKRVSEHLSEHQNKIALHTIQQLFQSMQEQKEKEKPSVSHKKIPIKADGKVLFINTREIPLIEANGDYINVYCNDRHYLVHDRLKRMEKELHSCGFMRIHRSFLINTTRVRSIENDAFGEYVFTFENCTKKVRSSRGYSENVHLLLNNPS